mmetsp:Transcript_19194/g.57241  ORF Transcript_19194/g.57241 Transcript_19194/m.57241 type:complete len:219 (-) Transcript_19194:837-1493(-)
MRRVAARAGNSYRSLRRRRSAQRRDAPKRARRPEAVEASLQGGPASATAARETPRAGAHVAREPRIRVDARVDAGVFQRRDVRGRHGHRNDDHRELQRLRSAAARGLAEHGLRAGGLRGPGPRGHRRAGGGGAALRPGAGTCCYRLRAGAGARARAGAGARVAAGGQHGVFRDRGRYQNRRGAAALRPVAGRVARRRAVSPRARGDSGAERHGGSDRQ